MTTKTYYATRAFTDAGTEKNFKQGDKVDATPGDIGNYEAAGLVTDKQTDAKAGDAKGADAGGKSA